MLKAVLSDFDDEVDLIDGDIPVKDSALEEYKESVDRVDEQKGHLFAQGVITPLHLGQRFDGCLLAVWLTETDSMGFGIFGV